MPLPPRIPSPPLSILLVSDFFLPHLGGVETHIYSLSQLLAAAGHAVTIVTKSLGGRCGVRCLPNSVKAYYAPFTELTAGTTVPTFTISYLYIRTILNREAINLVHTHQSTSVLANECCFYASILDIPVVHTDHSLFALGDLAGLHLSAAQSLVVDKAVQKNVVVSAVTGANVAARLGLGLERIAVIPNAVDSVIFHPLPESLTTLTRQTPSTITIAIISRLCYRKGTDILYNLIPLICSKHANVQVVIAGSGNKELLLNEMIERHDLADRVTLLGGLDTTAVVRTLQGADVMVNTSLTESFCIAILEAACAGNVVVSSDVGGVREVFANTIVEKEIGVIYAPPNAADMADAVSAAIAKVTSMRASGTVDATKQRWWKDLAAIYTWENVANDTTEVYYEAIRAASAREKGLAGCISRWCEGRTLIAGWVAAIFGVGVYAWIMFVNRFASDVEVSWNVKERRRKAAQISPS